MILIRVTSRKRPEARAVVEGLAEAVRDQASLTGAVGRTAMGTQALILHWAGREDALGVDEEELSAELQAVGS